MENNNKLQKLSGLYPVGSVGKDRILIGRTRKLYNEGKTPEEIAEIIKQKVDDVKGCIEFCKKARNE